MNTTNALPTATWEVSLKPAVPGESAWRARLLEQVRPALQERLSQTPDALEVTIPTGPFVLHARQRAGKWQPGGGLRLLCAADMPTLTPTSGASAETSDLPCELLPSPSLEQVATRLVGLEGIATQVLLRLACAWDGQAEEWSERTGIPLSPGFACHLADRAAAFVFVGDSGVGKSTLARTIADQYCRRAGTHGRILSLKATVRGSGLVGQFTQRLQAAFDVLKTLPAEELKCLLIDEADSVAMRRSEEQAHHEDRVGTNCCLQALDALAGVPRVLVILTTNLEAQIDAAVKRRCSIFSFPRPDLAARFSLLTRWLPHLERKEVERAARAAHGMSPADMERALESAFLEAIAESIPVTASNATICLRRGTRTRSV